ncbi:MAG: hypothetical protein ACLTYW_00665 [Collinsella sp.]
MADSKAEYPAPDCLAPAAIEAKTEAAGVTKATCRSLRPFCWQCSPVRLLPSAACSLPCS